LLLAIATVALVLLSPTRRLSADMVPGRLGALILNCSGTLELDRVDWIRKETERKQMFYFMQYDKQKQFTSVFGPMPALVGALAFLDVGEGDVISDASVRFRERLVGALLVALSAILLVLACAAQASLVRSIVAGSVAVLSFAGAATLGQGLWQATPALPFLVGALAAWAWREKHRWLAWIIPALLVQVVMIRPVVAPIALAIGLTWALETRTLWRTWIIASVIAVIPAVPWIVWNALHQNSPLSIAQWGANKKLATEHVFTVGALPEAVAGLLVSPARGILWFAPLAVAGVVLGLRHRQTRWIAIGCLAQVVFAAAFFRWHGGQAFGPRLLAELTWVAAFLALGTQVRLGRGILVPAVAVTILVGVLGLWRFRPEQWEQRRAPDRDPSVLWDVVDSPIPALLRPAPPSRPGGDDPPLQGYRCEGSRLASERAKS